jgi:glycosyltransferase involved in cell wall biosynthesis
MSKQSAALKAHRSILAREKDLKILHLNRTDIRGGAARAAYRIHRALLASGVDSNLLVDSATSDDWTVEAALRTKAARRREHIRQYVADKARSLLTTANPVVHTPAIVSSGRPRQLNTSDCDVVHLHWLGAEMMSVADIGRLRKPVAWTLHDMWAFCGAEHYANDYRWREGYHKHNRPAHESGFDLNRWTWDRKRRHWTRPMHIVAPSRWMAECVRSSALMADWPVHVIPNAIDTSRWRPIDQQLARDLLGLPRDVPLLLFGAMGGARDPRKGFDLLLAALAHLRGQLLGLELIVFGQTEPRKAPDMGFPVHYTGHLHDDLSLRALYSAANALVVPSRQDNLPNTAMEAQACGTPVVAFDIGGLSDIVTHQETGYLAGDMHATALAEGIHWTLTRRPTKNLSNAARLQACSRFENADVARQYADLYATLC